MKKLFAALLTLCMVFGMAVPAFAAGDPLTIRFYYGGADYGRYKEGWIDVGNIDNGAGRFYAAINFGDEEIGGICLEDVTPLMETGITGIAVSGAIIHAEDPVEETRRFINEINKY